MIDYKTLVMKMNHFWLDEQFELYELIKNGSMRTPAVVTERFEEMYAKIKTMRADVFSTVLASYITKDLPPMRVKQLVADYHAKAGDK